MLCKSFHKKESLYRDKNPNYFNKIMLNIGIFEIDLTF